MNDHLFNWLKISNVASRITTGYSLAALCIILVAVVISGVDIPEGQRVYAITGLLVATGVFLVILRSPQKVIGGSDLLRNVVESSDIPMYVTDENLVVKYCNDALLSVIFTERQAILEKRLEVLIDKFAERVPEERRVDFLEHQNKLTEWLKRDHAPHAEAEEMIDNRDLPKGSRFNGVYQVWIHADKIFSQEHKRRIGLLVFYHLAEVSDS